MPERLSSILIFPVPKGDLRAHSSASRLRILRKTVVTVLRVSPVSRAASAAERSSAKYSRSRSDFSTGILERLKYLVPPLSTVLFQHPPLCISCRSAPELQFQMLQHPSLLAIFCLANNVPIANNARQDGSRNNEAHP